MPNSDPGGHADAVAHASQIDMAFTGNYRGCIWNAQGLLASQTSKQEAKIRRILQLLEQQDFAIISETHSTLGKSLAIDTRLKARGLSTFWSHGGHRRAGVAIVVRDSFLDSLGGVGAR